PNRAKRLECEQLAAALDRHWVPAGLGRSTVRQRQRAARTPNAWRHVVRQEAITSARFDKAILRSDVACTHHTEIIHYENANSRIFHPARLQRGRAAARGRIARSQGGTTPTRSAASHSRGKTERNHHRPLNLQRNRR